MDEASGNFFGKQLIRAFYFKTMPEDLAKKFEEEYDLSPDQIKENVYSCLLYTSPSPRD